jgi:hypothetical protein
LIFEIIFPVVDLVITMIFPAVAATAGKYNLKKLIKKKIPVILKI